MRKTFLVLAAVAALAGCASVQTVDTKVDNPYAMCVSPKTRDAGMGVKVATCSAWEFGPSRKQAAAYSGNWRK
jgi:hypothetical protein